MQKISLILSLCLGLATFNTMADVATAQKLADRYVAAAKAIEPAYIGPTVAEGKEFFNREVRQFKGDSSNPGKVIACASCHTSNPADVGKHIVTGKPIKPLSPAVNPKRFRSMDKVEKKFSEHCNEVVGSDCTPQEKASYIVYLLTEKTPSK
jgi:hypothetical protein